MRLFRHPVLCNYYLTYRCNAACSFCDIWEKPSPYVTLENVRENLAALKRMKVKVVDFTGGEPLLHRELHHFLAEAKQLGFITTVTTNALLYPKYGERMTGLVDMLHFSLDSVDGDKHNASRKVDCFGHLQESIRLAKSWGEKPDILFTVTPENLHELPQLYQEYVLEQQLVVILNPIFSYNGVGETLTPSELAEMRKWGQKPGVYLNEAFLKLRKEGGNHIADPICKAGSSTVVISPENKLVLPCYHLGEGEIPINGDLEAVYNSPEAQKLIEMEGKLPGCEGCVINCYMEPSMAISTGSYFWSSLRSTVKYTLEKWVYA